MQRVFDKCKALLAEPEVWFVWGIGSRLAGDYHEASYIGDLHGAVSLPSVLINLLPVLYLKLIFCLR